MLAFNFESELNLVCYFGFNLKFFKVKREKGFSSLLFFGSAARSKKVHRRFIG